MKPAPETACLQCGYDLRGLAPDGVCPECAHPVALSLAVPLTLEDRRFFRRMAGGATIIALGQLLIAGALGAGFLLLAVGAERSLAIPAWIVIVGGAMWPVGWMLASVTPPAHRAHRRNLTRWVVRGLALVHLGAILGALSPWLSVTMGMRSWRVPDVWQHVGMGILLVSTYSLWTAGYFYLEETARVSLRSPRLAGRCGLGALLLGALLLAGLLLFIIGGVFVLPVVFLVGAGFVWGVRSRAKDLLLGA